MNTYNLLIRMRDGMPIFNESVRCNDDLCTLKLSLEWYNMDLLQGEFYQVYLGMLDILQPINKASKIDDVKVSNRISKYA